jgi:hypothetical protein
MLSDNERGPSRQTGRHRKLNMTLPGKRGELIGLEGHLQVGIYGHLILIHMESEPRHVSGGIGDA